MPMDLEWIISSRVNFTSLAVNSTPSWNRTPLRKRKVHRRPLSEICQEEAKDGLASRSSFIFTKPSKTTSTSREDMPLRDVSGFIGVGGWYVMITRESPQDFFGRGGA